MHSDQKPYYSDPESELTKDIIIIQEETEPCNCFDCSNSEHRQKECSCIPYTLLCCCGPINGISVVQPACQTLPDSRVVNNPSYIADLNKSFWTYKFMTDCNVQQGL